MAEHDRQWHLGLLEPVGHVQVALIGIKKDDVVTNDVEDPEDVGRPAHVTTDLGMAVSQERSETADAGTKIILDQGTAVDEAQHHEACLDMDVSRREPRLERRYRSRALAVAKDVMNRNVLAAAHDKFLAAAG